MQKESDWGKNTAILQQKLENMQMNLNEYKNKEKV